MSQRPALKRDFNLDIIRIIAFLFVPSVHFFLRNGFYSNEVDNMPMYIMTFMRSLFMLCIPLFLLLTGYLQGNKVMTPNKKYYSKILKVLVPYFIIMVIDLIFIRKVLQWEYTVKQYVENFTSFTHYSWYVEMYIGLFMMIPFLNILWQNLKTKKQEKILLVTFFILTILPSAINVYQFDSKDWFSAANTSNWYLIPDWWTSFYPITYYFTGAYLSKHKEEMKTKPIYAFLLFLFTWLMFGTYAILRYQNTTPSLYGWTHYNGAGIFFMGVTLFYFINSIPFNKVPVIVARFVGKLSDLTFGAYLASWCLDQILYSRYVNVMIPVMEDRLKVYPLVILLTATTAFVASFCVDIIYKGGQNLISLIKTKPNKTNEQ